LRGERRGAHLHSVRAGSGGPPTAREIVLQRCEQYRCSPSALRGSWQMYRAHCWCSGTMSAPARLDHRSRLPSQRSPLNMLECCSLL
jgi:hypothetical protein